MAEILSVDDSRVIRDLMKSILEAEGHSVTVAEDGVQALKIAREKVFDLVLSDINMPNMNGISLLGNLRRVEGYEYTPIIMVTTENDDYKKNKSKNLGATGWLVKPFTQERILAAVSKVLG